MESMMASIWPWYGSSSLNVYVLCGVRALVRSRALAGDARLRVVLRSADEELRRVVRVDEAEEPAIGVDLELALVLRAQGVRRERVTSRLRRTWVPCRTAE
jgi:hypothetical protein